MVNNALSVLISTKHLNISINRSTMNLLITKTTDLSNITVKRSRCFEDCRDAIKACNDWKFLR